MKRPTKENPAAALARLRAESLTAKERENIARKAARARWGSKRSKRKAK